jgi:hypothetical protein
MLSGFEGFFVLRMFQGFEFSRNQGFRILSFFGLNFMCGKLESKNKNQNL